MRTIGVLVGLLLWSIQPGWAADSPEEPTPERRKEQEKKVHELNEEGFRRANAHDFSGAAEPFGRAVEMARVLYPKKDFPGGHETFASSLHNLAAMKTIMGKYAEAEPLLRESLEMNRALYPRKKYPRGHPHLVANCTYLAEVYKGLAAYRAAEPLLRESLDMTRALYPKEQFPKGHFAIIQAMRNLADLYKLAGDFGKAELLCRDCLEMAGNLFPRKADRLGQMIINVQMLRLAELYDTVGEYGKAEPLFEEALRMNRARFPAEKYPNGSHDLQMSLTSLGRLYYKMGKYREAEPLLKEALRIARAQGQAAKLAHFRDDLGAAINDLALLYLSSGQPATAEPLFKEDLAHARTLYSKEEYPKGHPSFTATLSNLALLYKLGGEYGKAEPLYREALKMDRTLYSRDRYPHGHPGLARTLDNTGHFYLAAGDHAQAERLFREALDMSRRLLLDYAELAAEAECLNYLASRPATLDALLSVTRHLPESDAYDAVWGSRAALTRLQERRNREASATRDRNTAELVHRLHMARLALARQLFHPLDDADRQRAEVQKLSDVKEDLEKRIARKLGTTTRHSPQDSSPRRLAECLPAEAAFIDFYRYTDFEQTPQVKGLKGEKQTPRYVAFVVRRGKEVVRVELNEAAPIESAWKAWRSAILAARPEEKVERAAAGALANLLWAPLRKELPREVKTVYLAPAGVLHQVPWGALPGLEPGTVLLEEHAVCLVPHGPFLLGRLEEKGSAPLSTDTLVAYGGIDYENTARQVKDREDVSGPVLSDKRRLRWGDLPGTAREQEQVVALARKVLKGKPIIRSGRDASTRQLEEDLPRARYAHLATHGFFADPEFRSAFQVDPQGFKRTSQDRRGGARSPLVLSGLVLAGANRTGKDMAEDRGIMTAEGLLGLPLEGLELAVLSACETGLGEEGGREGVFGLQRAFHLAGCRSVVASLWKVNDGATQALMALFYHNLWEKKLDPVESLRQAQLTLYRHPSAVEVVRKRGFVFAERDLPKDAVEPDRKPKRSATVHWGAFTFSGARAVQVKGE